MSKIEKVTNYILSTGLFLGGASFFINSFFYTVDAGNWK